MSRAARAPRLRVIVLAALFGFSTFAVEAAPTDFPLPRPGALEPTPAAALGCASEPVFTGHITSSTSSTAVLDRTTTGNVYGYISDVVDDWSCTAYYRYDGMAWMRADGDGVFDWGAIIHSTSVPCNWVVGETNYVKANDTTDCADTDAEYAMPIALVANSLGNLLQGTWHADNSPDELGDFMFIHSDCTSYYEGSGMSGERVRYQVPFGSSEVTNRPGDNCDPTVIDGTGTSQTIIVDSTDPTSTVSADPISGTRTVAVNWTASDNIASNIASIRLYYATSAGGTYTQCQNITTTASSGTSTCTVPADGTFYLASAATDENTNAEPTPTASEDSVVVDTAAPTGTISIAGGATYTTSDTVDLTLTANGTGTAASQMQFKNGGGAYGSYVTYSTSFEDWVLAGADGTKTVYYQVKDAAGNESGASAISDTIVLDTVDPSASISINGGAAVTNVDDVTLNVASSDATSGVASTEASNDGSDYDPVAGSAPAWELTGPDGLKTVWFRVTDNAGRVTTVSDTITLIRDTDPPGAPSTPDLAAASDSGASTTDEVTNDTTPTFVGTAEANATVEIFDGSTAKGSAQADGSGNWSVTTSSLTDGVHAITAKATDAALNTSPASNALSVTIDTTAPSAPSVPDLMSASDSGTSSTDDITNDATPTLTGTAEANASVTLRADGTGVGSGSSVAGTWIITASTLTDGARAMTATATDAAGNTSTASSSLPVTVDTAAPAAPSTPDLAVASDTGASAIDDLTNDTTPTFTGTAETGATVELFDGVASLGSGPATGGNWSVTTSSHADGAFAVTAKATDLAGNTSTPSSGLTITIDTVAPSAPSVPDLDQVSDLGASDADDVTSDATPSVSGSTATADTVEIVDAAAVVGSGTPSAGAYAITVSSLADGSHELTARSRDAAGNASAASAALTVTVDTAIPTATFVNPSGFATQSTHDLTVSWSESGTGSTVVSRSVQREAAAAVSSGTCAGLTFAADGAPTTTTSPHDDEGLGDTTCYRWVVDLTDLAGNIAATTSAAIQTDLSGTTILRVRAAASSAVGAATYVSAVIEDGTGAVKPDYSGVLTISSSDTGAVFPDGTTFHRKPADKEVGHTFRVLFSTSGTHEVTVSAPSATAGETSVTVAAGALRAAAPETVYQGVPFKLAVIPRVGSKTTGPINRAYAAAVDFSSSDADPDFGFEVGGDNEYRFACACDGAHVFPTTLSEIGAQSITVTDEFGVTDTITVDVEAAPSGASSAITRIDVVEWPNGNFIDYYITSTAPYQLLSVSDDCGLSNRPLSELGASLATSTTSASGIARSLAEPDSPLNSGILPDDLESETYAEGTLRFQAEHSACRVFNFATITSYTFTYVDAAGRIGTVSPYRWNTFASVPGNANFVQQGADAPIVSWDVVSRGGTAKTDFIDPNTGGKIQYVPGGLVMQFELRSPITIYRVEFVPVITNVYNLGPERNTYSLPAGTSTVAMNDVPYHNSCGDSRDANASRIFYRGADGRVGVLGGVDLLPSSTFPNTGQEPDGWACDDDYQGQPSPPEPNNPIRDAFDKLGLDDTLGIVDAFTSLSHMTLGDPVDVSTGAQLGEVTDIALGGHTPALTLERRYRSDVVEAVANGGTPEARADGLLGVGWATNLDWKLEFGDDPDQIIVRGEGVGGATYRQLDDDSWSGPGWLRMTLEPDGTDWLLTRPAGDGYRFDGDGRLEALFDQTSKATSSPSRGTAQAT
jgi:hypothetical protein